MASKVTVCVGSSCHVRGSRLLLKRFGEIIRSEGVENDVVLVGSFCMERCGETTNWKFDDENIASAGLAEAEDALRAKLAETKRGQSPSRLSG